MSARLTSKTYFPSLAPLNKFLSSSSSLVKHRVAVSAECSIKFSRNEHRPQHSESEIE